MYGTFVYEAQNARKICHIEVVVETRCVGAAAEWRSTSSEACVLRACFVLCSRVFKKIFPFNRGIFLLNGSFDNLQFSLMP